MDGKILSVFLAALLHSNQVSGWTDTYRGAVVEYHPVLAANEVDTMLMNANNFASYMVQANRKGADIIVFPEGGLFSKIPAIIPEPVEEIAPCDINGYEPKAVKELSCASRKSKIYSVINLVEKRLCEPGDKNCPQRGHYLFNTNVVFDRNGVVRARYAKYNLFATDVADQPPEPEMGFFDTDFGVRFGTFICFDILFPTPAQKLVQQYHITDFVFSTFWFSELPFLTALQAQRGWAETNNVNLLASGVNVPITGSSGSGIYNGKFGHLVQVMPEMDTSKLLIADIPKIKPWLGVSQRERPERYVLPHEPHNFANLPLNQTRNLIMLKDDLSRFTSEVIKPGEKFERKICTPKNFCCEFKVKMQQLLPESKNYTYRALVFDGVRQFGAAFRGGAQTCSVVICTGTKVEDCGSRMKDISGLFRFEEITITGNFKWKNAFQMPSTLAEGKEFIPLSANKYEFTRTKKDGSAEVSLQLIWPVSDLHTFAIWGRDFTRDNETITPESSATTAVSFPILFGALISFLVLVR